MPSESEPVVVKLGAENAGERLDKVLATRCPDFSRSQIQQWIAAGRVHMDGATASRKTRAVDGASVTLWPAAPEMPRALAQAIPLRVLFEDADVLVIDKQAGLVVHPAPGHPDGTLVNAVLHHTHVEGGEDALRPGIVHRLDKDTSGVMVVAKTPAAHERLVDAFSVHAVERAYLAIAVGHLPDTATFETLHGRHPVHRKKFSTKVQRGKRAVTHMRTLERWHGTSLVQCRLETGRTHQIRVHLADHGHHVLGDPLYGRSIADPSLRKIGQQLGRQALHATLLGFQHPTSGEALRFETPVPADMQIAMDALRSATEKRP